MGKIPRQSRESKFGRGFGEVRDRVERGKKFLRSCLNCQSYYSDLGDNHDVCQNPNVTKFDLVVTDNNTYCSYWKQCTGNKCEKETLNGRGRLYAHGKKKVASTGEVGRQRLEGESNRSKWREMVSKVRRINGEIQGGV